LDQLMDRSFKVY